MAALSPPAAEVKATQQQEEQGEATVNTSEVTRSEEHTRQNTRRGTRHTGRGHIWGTSRLTIPLLIREEKRRREPQRHTRVDQHFLADAIDDDPRRGAGARSVLEVLSLLSIFYLFSAGGGGFRCSNGAAVRPCTEPAVATARRRRLEEEGIVGAVDIQPPGRVLVHHQIACQMRPVFTKQMRRGGKGRTLNTEGNGTIRVAAGCRAARPATLPSPRPVPGPARAPAFPVVETRRARGEGGPHSCGERRERRALLAGHHLAFGGELGDKIPMPHHVPGRRPPPLCDRRRHRGEMRSCVCRGKGDGLRWTSRCKHV